MPCRGHGEPGWTHRTADRTGHLKDTGGGWGSILGGRGRGVWEGPEHSSLAPQERRSLAFKGAGPLCTVLPPCTGAHTQLAAPSLLADSPSECSDTAGKQRTKDLSEALGDAAQGRGPLGIPNPTHWGRLPRQLPASGLSPLPTRMRPPQLSPPSSASCSGFAADGAEVAPALLGRGDATQAPEFPLASECEGRGPHH